MDSLKLELIEEDSIQNIALASQGDKSALHLDEDRSGEGLTNDNTIQWERYVLFEIGHCKSIVRGETLLV